MSLKAIPTALLLAAIGIPAAADTGASQERPTALSGHAEAGNQARFSRDQWGLDEAEWQRYQTLMTGIRASISPATLSPVEVLGIHARDEAERKKYARLFAETMRDDTERVLAFQRAYDEAWRELNPSGKTLDASKLPTFQNPIPPNIQFGDRLLLFVKPQGCPACDERLGAALKGRLNGARLDIYIVGSISDDFIRAWAQQHGIDAQDVKTKQITLNHESGQLAQVAGTAATPPLLALLRNNQITLLQPNTKP